MSCRSLLTTSLTSAVFFPFGISFPHTRDLTAGAAAVWRSWSTGSRSADRQKSPGVYLGRLSRRVQNNSVSAGMAGSVVPNGEESREKRSITWRLTAGWLSEHGSKIPTNAAGNERLRNQGKWEEHRGLSIRRTNSLTAFLFQWSQGVVWLRLWSNDLVFVVVVVVVVTSGSTGRRVQTASFFLGDHASKISLSSGFVALSELYSFMPVSSSDLDLISRSHRYRKN